MSKERSIETLLSRYLRGELDEEEIKALEIWRETSPRNEALFQRVTSMNRAEEAIRRFVYPEEEEEQGWQALHQQIKKRDQQIRRRKTARGALYAASVALLLAAAGALYILTRQQAVAPVDDLPFPVASPTLQLPDGSRVNLGDKEALDALAVARPGMETSAESLSYTAQEGDEGGMHLLSVPRGGEYVLTLSDGTSVYLNAETELIYPAAFPDSCREVYLQGEAYFKVSKDARRPFAVHAGPARVEVTGTSFGVRAYEDEPVIQAVLESGSVNLRAGDRAIALVPNTRGVYNKEEGTLETLPANPAYFLGWKEGRLVYDNVRLEDILRDACRWYPFGVVFKRDSIRSLPFSLNMKRHGSVIEVLHLLEATGKIRFEYDDRTITIL
ncbi:MAG: FecR domain-containing protein [Odoribacteraceae bacterium]|jgi:ferric-dicitrate binding protein FerR (iron transport regulator)|nr:FecR domain-containing protein [Odoribacteraceae bacterium]